MNTMQCGVSGIQNKECKTQIKNALNKLDGIQDVGVDQLTGTVKVRYNDPVTATEIKSCIESSGFKIVYE